MAYEFPADVASLVQEQMALHGYRSQDAVLRDALRLFREMRTRDDCLFGEVAASPRPVRVLPN